MFFRRKEKLKNEIMNEVKQYIKQIIDSKIHDMVKHYMDMELDHLRKKINTLNTMLNYMGKLVKYGNPYHLLIMYRENSGIKRALANVLRYHIKPSGNLGIYIFEKYIDGDNIPYTVEEYEVITPVIAWYDNKDDEFTVELMVGDEIFRYTKIRGVDWVYLVLDIPIVYGPKSILDIKPKPRKVVVLQAVYL